MGLLNIAPGDFFETELTLPGEIEEQIQLSALSSPSSTRSSPFISVSVRGSR